jgi:hypothetical protein
MARSESDPRYNGYAEAALRPWWSLPHPPNSVLLLRAPMKGPLYRDPSLSFPLGWGFAAPEPRHSK